MINQPGPLELSAPGAGGLDGTMGKGASLTLHLLDLLNSHAHLFVIAFLVTLLATPVVRRVALRAGVVDLPDARRKMHAAPVPYLGGVAVFLGLIVAIAVSYFVVDGVMGDFEPIPWAIVVGMFAITFTGLADDVWGWDPRLKIAGQLIAAAALAIDDVGVHVAQGILQPLMGPGDHVIFTVWGSSLLNEHVFYWTGTAIIAIFVLGGCNSANLIDGLDGLLTGTIAIVAVGLLIICLLMASQDPLDPARSLSGARVATCVILLGATLGFLPHNFNPASIFLGDCGSLLLGYMCVVIILMLGDRGQTHLVFAGLIVYSLPIMDTMLAIIRRKLAGTSMSAADDQHIHHQLKRALGGVKRAVVALYGISIMFAAIGVALAYLVMATGLRVRVIYAMAIVLFSSIGVIAVKAARRRQHEAQQQALARRPERPPARDASSGSSPAAPEAPVSRS